MIKQNIFIINFNSLYEILDEIKENLSFDIINHESEENFTEDKTFDNKNALIITKSNNKLVLFEKNILKFWEYPLPLNGLVELINIQLIKIKFNYQSRIIVKDYELDLNSKTLSKDHKILKLTEKEIEIILYLKDNKNKHSVLNLQKNIWGYTADIETHTVETHVYRLRKKIFNKFNDNGLILSHPKGYFLN